MGKSGKRGVDEYESDGGFISNDDGPKSKKSKKTENGSNSNQRDADGKFWSLSTGRQPRRVEISEFKNVKLINIREFYEKDEQYLPGKKGISLTVEQYLELVKAIPEINTQLIQMGVKLDDEDIVEETEGEDESKPAKKKSKAKKEKSNIEETSEEDEG